MLQRPEELGGLAKTWTGRRPGLDLPAVYLEHNAPDGPVNAMTHPAADHPEVTVAHVTHFNQLFWNTGAARSVVIEHGIVDPGYRYRGTIPHAAVVVNDPGPRARVTGTDLLGDVPLGGPARPVRDALQPYGGRDLPQDQLHDEMAARRIYLHPNRWTSLGLSLVEAMQLGMPVVAVAATEVREAVPPDAGIVSTRTSTLTAGLRG